jgi:hypothetical protein
MAAAAGAGAAAAAAGQEEAMSSATKQKVAAAKQWSTTSCASPRTPLTLRRASTSPWSWTTDAGAGQRELKPLVDVAAVVAPAIESKRSSRSAEGASAEAAAVVLSPISMLSPRPSRREWQHRRGSWPPS